MTLNGVLAVILHYFSEFGGFLGALRKSGWRYTVKECSPKDLVFSDISLTMIWCREPLHWGD